MIQPAAAAATAVETAAGSAPRPISVAVIGGGPGGMFFCHAVEKLSQELKKKNCQDQDNADFQTLDVTCFDRASQAGGVWRVPTAANNNKDNGATNSASPESSTSTSVVGMYSGLWTNGPSHTTEFADYTFDEHFGRPISFYMPRSDMLGYLMARITKNCPNFVNKYMEFEKEIQHVVFDEELKQFCVTVQCIVTKTVTTRYFDKCIWACGSNGKPTIPGNMLQIFDQGGFRGRMIHSADTSNLKEDVCGKRILLIGGAYSAEDLALQVIKLGVEKVYISTRHDEAAVTWTGAWPEDKVQILSGQGVSAVTENGRCIEFKTVEWTWPNGYKFDTSSDDEDEDEKKAEDEDETIPRIWDIDTVIFCTGYSENVEMLDQSVRVVPPRWGTHIAHPLEVPKDWKMPPSDFDAVLDPQKVVVPGSNTLFGLGHTHPDLYRGIFIPNPHMMYICENDSDTPLLALDVNAHLLASFVLGKTPLPSAIQMREANHKQALYELTLPYSRYYMDEGYWKAINEAWEDGKDPGYTLWDANKTAHENYVLRLMARNMREADYPLDIGTYECLNENGLALLEFSNLSYKHRTDLNSDDPRKTFRDCSDNADTTYSVFTKTRAVPLPQSWLAIDMTNFSMMGKN